MLPCCLTEFIACRLIPLDKGTTKEGKPGVRPIGVGEVLRRLIGKLVIDIVKDDIVTAAGPLQTCTGLRAGIEATIHAMRSCFEKDSTEGLLLVDAENAFNNLNREAALSNIKQLCPPFYRYMHNTYQKPARMIIAGEKKHEEIYSAEGSTQGDVGAMGAYGIGIAPMVGTLREKIDIGKCIQAWYADDSSSAGELAEMRKWWDTLCTIGPKYGYFPLPTKTILIVKEQHLAKAQEIFGECGVKITTRGERHMGAVIGSDEFKEMYVSQKIAKWVEDVEALTEIAKDEPQAVYASYTKAISHRWTYIQRTIPNISNLFAPLEACIREKLIPALIGRNVSDLERNILALPVRMGGIGITNPIQTADHEFSASVEITRNLTDIISRQENNFDNYDKAEVEKTIKLVKERKNQRIKEDLENIVNMVNDKTKRVLELTQEKGAGAWLTTSPIQALGFALNKQQFRDAICLRYGWRVPNTPNFCHCKKENNIDHCKTPQPIPT